MTYHEIRHDAIKIVKEIQRRFTSADFERLAEKIDKTSDGPVQNTDLETLVLLFGLQTITAMDIQKRSMTGEYLIKTEVTPGTTTP